MKKALALLAVMLFCSCSEGSITRQVVSRAWRNVTKADGFENLPIQYENDNSPNAWVMFQDESNFTIHVTKGLMNILNTEAEIAGVLGHEIGHVRLGHYNDMELTETARIIMGTNLEQADQLAQVLGNIDMDLKESSFSREQETEADNYGVKLLVKAGYDSWGLYNAMKCFDDNGYETERNGFNSHPASKDRLKNLSDMARASSSGRNDDYGDKNKVDEVNELANILMGL